MKNFIRSIWQNPENNKSVFVIDQRFLPFEFCEFELSSSANAVYAINEMVVRGAPLIGVTAAWGVYFAYIEALNQGLGFDFIKRKSAELVNTRPTAVDLKTSVDKMISFIQANDVSESAAKELYGLVKSIETASENQCRDIGLIGLALIEKLYSEKNETVNILTHCNAGKLATVNYGTALAPVYLAHEKGIPVHVWVDETRPRMQGAYLTAWELAEAGIEHTVIVDNAGGHLMQHHLVDLVITGADRLTINGDAANKIGTYLKALAAHDNQIPFYVAVPSSTFDFQLTDGVRQIPVEYRNDNEIKQLKALVNDKIKDVLVMSDSTNVLNPSFDVTPANYITAFITERGICSANKESLLNLFPEFAV